MDVSIIIVNYNTFDLTSNCINSVIEHTRDLFYEIIVVDNSTSNESYEQLIKEFSNIKIIRNQQNLGFGGGNNLGIINSNSEYVFLLNSDTILLNNAIKIFYDFIVNHNKKEDIGVLGCLLMNKELKIGRSSDDLPTLEKIVKDAVRGYFSRFVLRRPTSFVQKIIPVNKEYLEVGFILGADLFIPRKVLNMVGLFDTNFFMYFEEIDLQARIKSLGYKRLLINGPKIVHLEGQSNNSTKKYLNYYKSMFQYIKKHKLIKVF